MPFAKALGALGGVPQETTWALSRRGGGFPSKFHCRDFPSQTWHSFKTDMQSPLKYHSVDYETAEPMKQWGLLGEIYGVREVGVFMKHLYCEPMGPFPCDIQVEYGSDQETWQEKRDFRKFQETLAKLDGLQALSLCDVDGGMLAAMQSSAKNLRLQATSNDYMEHPLAHEFSQNPMRPFPSVRGFPNLKHISVNFIHASNYDSLCEIAHPFTLLLESVGQGTNLEGLADSRLEALALVGS